MPQDDLVIRAAIRDELTAPLEAIRAELRNTGQAAETAGRRANIGARGFDAMAGGVGRMARTAAKVGIVALTGITTAIGAVAVGAATMGIKTAAEMQNASVAFTTMLGSAQKAGAFLTKLKAFAASTPFEFPELQDAASSLISAGINADKVIPIMTTLGNVTSGMGTGSEGIQRATVALQQMTAAGKISGEDLNQLRDAGIPVYDLLAKATGKSKAEVVKLAQAGKLGKKELGQMMAALESGKGMERFAGLMDKQSKTLGGVWSTLKDTVNMGLAGAFEPAIPILSDLVLKASDLASNTIFPKIKDGLKALVDLAPGAWSALKSGDLSTVVSTLDSVTGSGGKLSTFFETQLKPTIDDVTKIIRDVFTPALKGASDITPSWTTPLGLAKDVLGFVADHTTTFKVALEGLVVAMTAAKAIQLGQLAVTKVQAAWATTVSVATRAWAVGQWLLNTALGANPIGLVILGVAALTVGIVALYKKSETFRQIVTVAFDLVKLAALGLALAAVGYFRILATAWLTVVGGIVDGAAAAFGWVPGLGPKLKGAASKFHDFKDAANRELGKVQNSLEVQVKDAAAKAKLDALAVGRTAVITVKTVQSQSAKNADRLAANGISGDTATSHARGAGGLGSTLATHAALSSGQTITNALVGGGGRGRGSGDHQAGRALDLTGPGLPRYASKLRAAGGFAQMHGNGSGRHLHAVYPAGDTSRSMAPRAVRAPARTGTTAAPVVIGAGAIVVTSPASTVDLERGIADGIERWMRDREERA